jgi:hypothetical protein
MEFGWRNTTDYQKLLMDYRKKQHKHITENGRGNKRARELQEDHGIQSTAKGSTTLCINQQIKLIIRSCHSKYAK